jgi:DNA-binding transcriptional MerR regulator
MKASMRNDAKHRTYAVGELARLSGVTIRTLHHYDSIGLLKPASVGENGYRLYGREELLRLQQILLHRELGMSLNDIAAVLDAPGFDRLEALRRQRAHLGTEMVRYRRLLRTIDRTIADMEGEPVMKDAQLYKGFDPAKQAEYETWLIDRYGGDMAEQISRSWVQGASSLKDEAAAGAVKAELEAVERALGQALADGLAEGSPTTQTLIGRHHAIISRFWSPTAEAYAGLGDLYLEHPDFRARYEAVQPGLTAYLAAAMKVFAADALA